MAQWENPLTILIWLAFVVLIILIFIIAFIMLLNINYKKKIENQKERLDKDHEHKQEILRVSIQSEEKERQRIAADIHDDLMSKLTAVKMMIQVDRPKDEIDELVGRSIELSRNISHNLSPPLLDMLSISEIFLDVTEPWRRIFRIEAYEHRTGRLGLEKEFKLHLLRIVQELITNTHKHAKASLISLHWRSTEKHFTMIYEDNGTGFTKNSSTGLGLKNIELRVDYLKGRYKIKDQSGFLAIFVFPRTNENS